MLQVFKTAARVAATDATVLIQGESGTGKELVARAIHLASPREKNPFVAVDCGAIAEGVLESELFGHAKGAFTGAQAARRGLFEEADGGTLFLDEIGDVGPKLQAQLLRAVQEGEVRRVGTNDTVTVNVPGGRGHQQGPGPAGQGGQVPRGPVLPAQRGEHRAAAAAGAPRGHPAPGGALRRQARPERAAAISPEAREVLTRYTWPGNVRELENSIARALALNPSGVDPPRGLSRGHPGARPAVPTPSPPIGRRWPSSSDRYAEVVLGEAQGNKTRAAEILGDRSQDALPHPRRREGRGESGGEGLMQSRRGRALAGDELRGMGMGPRRSRV